ncbi:hypothetical protein GF407_07030 [candidate division KSB1 bacterium]|nr:hypothetical protein [candidate division KSB1 bacterium]
MMTIVFWLFHQLVLDVVPDLPLSELIDAGRVDCGGHLIESHANMSIAGGGISYLIQ